MKAILHSWFKPLGTFEIDGSAWVDASAYALRCPPFDPGLIIRSADVAAQVAPLLVRSVARKPEPARNGHTRIGGAVFDSSAVALVEAAIPGCTWHHSGDKRGPATAWFFGKCRAVVMPRLNDDVAPATPACAACGGHGRGRCTCPCGHTHMVAGACPGCNGTGKWSAS